MTPYKDIFISYGRRESLGFVGRLHQHLKLAGFEAWFDKVNIPDGEDYAARINYGIESAHNFAYVMAPRCLTSPYCLIELEYARYLGKRVIPINQMVIFATEDRALSTGDQELLTAFYRHYGIIDPYLKTAQAVLNRSLAVIGHTDWLDAKEILTDEDCAQLATWARHYENFWHQHEDVAYLRQQSLPVFGSPIDSLVTVIERVITVLRRHEDYVHTHTQVLHQALLWQQQQRSTQYLAVGKERYQAEDWLLTQFAEGEQAPCQPAQLMCDFVCESRKNAEHMMTDTFMCYHIEDKAFRDQVVNALSRYAITSWRHDRDIQSGSEYRRAIEQGIEQADNFFFLISPHSVVAEQCQRELNHAAQYHKRIVPLLIAAIDETLLPEPLRGLQSIDNQSLDEILALLKRNKTYYEQHKILLVQALKWSSGGRKLSFLLRGYNLEHAKTWLRLHQQRTLHGPTALHHEFIQASEAARGQLHTEVFISYSRKDGDFARQLNLALQEAGKTTWFDQESISSGADFEQEIFKGISSSDNFVFILSPDAVTSEYCEREVNFAAQQNKRFIPLLWREGAVEAMPEALRQVHWVDFKDEVFDKSFTLLIQAIEIDRQHAYQHTLLQQRAEDWQQHQRHHDFLLNKTACVNALNWLTAAKHKQPPPTPLQQEFIAASQQAIEAGEAVERARQQRELMIERQNTQRQRVLVSALSLAFIMAVLVGGSAFWFYIQATLQIDKIFVRDLSAQARLQVDVAPQLGVLLALETVLRADELGGHERAAAEETLRQTLEQISGLAIEGYQPVLAFSPDERWLAIADYDVRLWDLTQTDPLRSAPIVLTPGAPIQTLAFAADWLAVARQDNTVALWSMQALEAAPQILRGHIAPVLALAFQPGGHQLATGSADRTVRLWDLTQMPPQNIQTLSGHNSFIQTISWGRRWLVTASLDNTVRIWDASGTAALMLQKYGAQLSQVVFSADQRWIATATETGMLDIWDRQAAVTQPVMSWQASEPITALAFSPQSQGLALATGQRVQLFALQENEWHATQLSRTEKIKALTFLQENILVTSVEDKRIYLWDLKNNSREQRSPPALHGHSKNITALMSSPQGHWLATASTDGIVRLWDMLRPSTMTESIVLHGHEDTMTALALSDDGRLLATGSQDNTIRIWDLTAQVIDSRVIQGNAIKQLAFSPSGQWLAGSSEDNSIRLWPVQSAQAGASILVNDAEQQVNVSALLFDSEEQLWILNSGQSADKNVEHRWRQLQLQHFKALMIHSLDYFKAHINSALLTSAGQLMITTNHDSVERFSLSEPERIERWLIPSSTLKESRMEKKMEQVIDGGKQQQSQYPVQVLSLDGNRLATQKAYSAQHVQLWRLKPGAPAQEMPKQIESPLPITAQALNANGQWLATGTPNGIIHLWDLTQAETKIKPIALRGHDDAITKLIFSRDSQWLISGSEDNTVRLWQVSLDRLFELGCWAVGRHLTEAEWRDYFDEQPYRQTCEAYLP